MHPSPSPLLATKLTLYAVWREGEGERRKEEKCISSRSHFASTLRSLSIDRSTKHGVRYDAWTSWGAGTRASGFNLTKFQVEVTWSQFQQLLVGVTEEDGDPSAVYGPRWNSTDAWVLLRAGYGQENYNRGTTTSVLEGLFQSLEVLSLA